MEALLQTQPDCRVLQALAGAAIYPLVGELDDDPETPAHGAYSAIIWSPAVDRLIREDDRFSDTSGRYSKTCDRFSGEPDKSHDAVDDRLNIVNRFGEREAFCIGFDLALQLGARLASNPLEKIDAADLLDAAREQCLSELREHRDRLWDRLARDRQRKAPVPAGETP
ncbi:MAG: hypothetical protein GIX03_07955 [Candidatus Eremiobacteraeota bacterium]|nr:hypothetical protein [Candidatus Eremiobacteraeota bacterium]